MSELVGAISSLNMEADPIIGATGYLSETDAWAKHAVDHMHAVFVLLNEAYQEREGLKTKIFRLEVAAAKARLDAGARHSP